MLRIVIFLLVGAAVAVLASLGLTLPAGSGLDETRALAALGAGLVAGLAAALHTRPASLFRPDRVSPWAWLTLAAFAVFALRAFCWLVFQHDDRLEITSPNNLGDLSLHLMLANYFAAGAAWWPDNPQYAWGSLQYYPGVDLLQALLQLAGAPELQTLVWVSLLGSLAAAVALYAWSGGFGVAAFLFAGGLAGFQIFETGRFADYQADLAWKSLPLAIFVTQRGFLFALPAGVLLLAHWRQKFFPPRRSAPEWPGGPSRQAGEGLIPFWAEVVLYTAMPVFQLYTFGFLSLLLGWWLVVYFSREALRRHVVLLLALAILPASALISAMTGAFSATGSVHLHLGWMQDGDPFLTFWLRNFGLFAPLAAGLWLYRMWPGKGDEADDEPADAFVLPAGLIFLFASVVMLSSWEWDNTKLMLWCYLAATPFIWEKCVAPFAAPIRWPICAALFFSGAVCVVGGLGPGSRNLFLATRSEVDAVRTAVRDLPIEARFAAAPAYNHPLVFAGRKLALGYEGHLSSQGINYRPVAADQRSLMMGTENWPRAARRLGVRYIFWGAREKKLYPDSAKPWAAREAVASGDWGALYEIAP